MLAHAVCLAAMLGLDCTPTQPPRPDFYALIPPTRIWACSGQSWPGRDWFGYAARRYEAHVIARYLNRCWSQDVLTKKEAGSANGGLNYLMILQQFDTSLWVLDPNPTVADAVTRIRTYGPIHALAWEQLRNSPKEEPKPGRLPPEAHFERFQNCLSLQYGPLLARFWWRVETQPQR